MASSLSVLLFCNPVLAKRRTLPDQTIATPVGNFRITSLNCNHGLGAQFIDGKIINETSKSWDVLHLAMELRDKNGPVTPKEKPSTFILMQEPSASAGMSIPSLGMGRTSKFHYQQFVKADNNTFSVTFKFAGGRYAVHYQMTLTKPVAANNLEYHDDVLAITFSLQRTEIDFVLQNSSNDPIKVDWNAVSFIQPGGTSQGVIHKGTKLADKQATKPPSMIPPKAKIEDLIVPVENVEFVAGDWLTHSLLVDGPAALNLVGQEFSIFMPLDIGGTTKNYTFTFKIVGVD